MKYYNEILTQAEYGNIDEIKRICENAIQELELKNSKGGTAVTRRKKAISFLNKLDDRRIELGGASIQEIRFKPCQCFNNGYIAFALYEPFEGLPEAINPLQLNKFFSETSEPVTADIVHIRTFLKTQKAKNKGLKNKNFKLYHIGTSYYNPENLVIAIDILGGDITFAQEQKELATLFLESENGLALIMPVRPPKNGVN